ARIIAVSYKEVDNPKIGLTMRQDSLGKLEWIQELAEKKKAKPAKKEEKK
ncbi:DNA-directed RNA polymerase, partial [Candidatus Woesearchaeota archaeon]|nr:DNA-directed RNA polymerase [Candidatus Woesearchaeota archaeon]